jgi:hypothetical protein
MLYTKLAHIGLMANLLPNISGYSCQHQTLTRNQYKSIADDLLFKGVICIGAGVAIYTFDWLLFGK